MLRLHLRNVGGGIQIPNADACLSSNLLLSRSFRACLSYRLYSALVAKHRRLFIVGVLT